MSMLARNARALVRTVPKSRPYSLVVDAPASQWAQQREAVKHHSVETTTLWRRISLYVCLPGIVATAFWVRNVEAEHSEHVEHVKKEHGGELPPPPDYEYLNRRSKPFPWGPNSLFFNPHVNKDMSA
ncbi:hypothetical protein EWM64_g3341 [Hericium alpestre]|uniref:Mitochondrial cytochrome c oxidase subunit VIa n=1 Tax=Hericium alpestre TaxID=135208 RepID=A0A4Z0A0K7_9AGAM|nr:hypothetical protein EWM64_g3341 [Hericium alpestre]